MKQVKVISENFDIVGEIYNVYTMDEVKQYMEDNDIDTTVFENEYKEQFTDFDNKEDEEEPYGIFTNIDETLDDIDLTDNYDCAFIYEDEFEDVTDEYRKKIDFAREDDNINEIFKLKYELSNFNERYIETVYDTYKKVIEYADRMKEILNKNGLE